MAPHHVATPSPIMVCLDDPRTCAAAIERASELARQRGAGLHVLASLDGGDDHKTRRRRRRRLSDCLHAASPVLVKPPRLTGETRIGSLTQTAIEAGTEVRPSLVVIGNIPNAGRTAIAIADALEAPVLVARRRTLSGRLIVATDLRRASRPIVAAGLRYVRPRSGAITIFYATTPTGPGEASRFVPLQSVDRRTLDRAGGDRYSQLRELGQDNPGLGIVIGTCRDPSSGIVAYVTEMDADVVAVGYAQRATYGSQPHRTTEQIVEEVRCSVLVVPLARELEID